VTNFIKRPLEAHSLPRVQALRVERHRAIFALGDRVKSTTSHCVNVVRIAVFQNQLRFLALNTGLGAERLLPLGDFDCANAFKLRRVLHRALIVGRDH